MRSTTLNKLVTLALFTTVVFSETYYVSNSGDDDNSGISKDSPWRTIKKVNEVVGSGNTVYFHKGNIFKDQGENKKSITLVIENKSNITIGSYGNADDKPIISISTNPNSIGTLRDDSDNIVNLALKIDESQNITIKDLEFRGIYSAVWIMENSHNITLKNLTVGEDSLNGIIVGMNKTTDSHNSNIIISDCKIINRFDKFNRSKEDNSMNYANKESFMLDQTGDGILVYSMTNSNVKNNYLKDWGHASINMDATNSQAPRNISNNKILNNFLTSPNIAYGGRIVVDQAYSNNISNNQVINTAVSSQLNGHDNNYTNNIFHGTRSKKNFSAHSAVSVALYNNEDVHGNNYINNKIIDAKNGVGLKVINYNNYYLYNNIFKGNIISNCEGEDSNNIQLDIGSGNPYDEHNHLNVFIENIISGKDSESVVSYHKGVKSLSEFNAIPYETYEDNIHSNIQGDHNSLTLKIQEKAFGNVTELEFDYYKISASSGDTITTVLDGFGKDTDLYVKIGEQPTTASYDCKSTNYKIVDSCSVTLTNDDNVYIGVYGFEDSNYQVRATTKDKLHISDFVEEGEIKSYSISAKAGQSLYVLLEKLSADADLYVKIGEEANKENFDCKSEIGNKNNDRCTIEDIKEDSEVYISVYGFRAANYTLNAILSNPDDIL